MFALTAAKSADCGSSVLRQFTCPSGWITCTLFMLSISVLYQAVKGLESPFDGEGHDDIHFTVVEDIELVAELNRVEEPVLPSSALRRKFS